MTETSKNLNEIIAKNLIAFRKHKGLTQFELAEKLNYSDKSISKWERGEGTPDIVVLKTLADLYSTTVDSFLNENLKIEKSIKRNKWDQKKIRLSISLFVMGAVWFIAAALYTIVTIALSSTDLWLLFIYAIPASLCALYFFNMIWGNKRFKALVLSGIVWTLALALYLTLSYVPYMWLLFVLAAVFQIMMLLWIFYLHAKLSRKKK